jgi:hypothetical protein
MVLAFITVQTHPQKQRVELRGAELQYRKKGFAPWQFMEVEDENV